ncbi:hypothetical protein EYF80_006043 [Liparis tanakae]|uniref:Uncharacterized protein n=1 Tax=Liparis tanakae TaxID=230148 RepID=A0A4Z2IZP9_9TELE|nr:hypothetical protein EYF80_006043 [Liparis tanakae]
MHFCKHRPEQTVSTGHTADEGRLGPKPFRTRLAPGSGLSQRSAPRSSVGQKNVKHVVQGWRHNPKAARAPQGRQGTPRPPGHPEAASKSSTSEVTETAFLRKDG